MMAEAALLLSASKTISVTNTPERLVTLNTPILAVSVKYDPDGTSRVRIGPSTVSATSYPLDPGESVEFDFIDLFNVFVFGPSVAVIYYFGLRATQ